MLLGEIMKYIKGEPSILFAGTIEMALAKTAKELVAKDPTLLTPGRAWGLMDALDCYYDGE
jgi:hypothetical protein